MIDVYQKSLLDIKIIEDSGNIKIQSGSASALTVSVDAGSAVALGAYGTTYDTGVSVGTETTLIIAGTNFPIINGVAVNNTSALYEVTTIDKDKAHFTGINTVGDVVKFMYPRQQLKIKVSGMCAFRCY